MAGWKPCRTLLGDYMEQTGPENIQAWATEEHALAKWLWTRDLVGKSETAIWEHFK